MKKYAIILAAGKGTRMKTELPKCAYPLLKKPMIAYIVEHLYKSTMIDELITVVGHKKEVIQEILNATVNYAVQEEQLGTGHAVLAAKDYIKDEEGYTIILPGDMPLIDVKVIKNAISEHIEFRHDLTVVSTIVDEPFGYGRIIRDEANYLNAIIEENDAKKEQKLIKEINTGIYIIENKFLVPTLMKIKNNNSKKEYYLTDMVKIMKDEKRLIGTYLLEKSYKAMGINDLYTLSKAETILRNKINKDLMISGVAMINPETITIGQNVLIEENVVIHPNTYIGENVVCKHSLVFNSKIDRNTTVGPFAHLRDGAEIGENNRIGNFVEVKKSVTKDNFKASHLAYIGDAEIGKNVNFGCGSITVNYDGFNKYKTIIGDDVFVGCNSNLIAPIIVDDNSIIAAGSTLDKNVPKGSLAIARAYQVNKENYVRKRKKNY